MNNYVVIDIETSGINPDKDEIIRLSALSIVNGNEAGTFFKLVKPIKPLTEEMEQKVKEAINKLTNQED